jgi:hypothetical protein
MKFVSISYLKTLGKCVIAFFNDFFMDFSFKKLLIEFGAVAIQLFKEVVKGLLIDLPKGMGLFLIFVFIFGVIYYFYEFLEYELGIKFTDIGALIYWAWAYFLFRLITSPYTLNLEVKDKVLVNSRSKTKIFWIWLFAFSISFYFVIPETDNLAPYGILFIIGLAIFAFLFRFIYKPLLVFWHKFTC